MIKEGTGDAGSTAETCPGESGSLALQILVSGILPPPDQIREMSMSNQERQYFLTWLMDFGQQALKATDWSQQTGDLLASEARRPGHSAFLREKMTLAQERQASMEQGLALAECFLTDSNKRADKGIAAVWDSPVMAQVASPDCRSAWRGQLASDLPEAAWSACCIHMPAWFLRQIQVTEKPLKAKSRSNSR